MLAWDMLLVILGAGASYDSLPSELRNEPRVPQVEQFRPPLAQELFEDREHFGRALDHNRECSVLVRRLRQAIKEGGNVEQELERYQHDAEEYPPLRRQLLSLLFYLQEILWASSNHWRDLSHGATNYAELLYRLDKWRYSEDESICMVTFNYDLLLDEAAVTTLGVDLGSVEAYAADDRYKFLKLHGSVNWSRRVHSPGGTHYSKPDHARRVLIDNAENLAITEDFVLRAPDEPISVSRPYAAILMPAITIPVEAKSDFECPRSHIEALDSAVAGAFRILVIGWRGMERHFLDRLAGLPGKAPAIEIVTGSESGVEETTANLATTGLAPNSMRGFTDGFAAYLDTDNLEEFLQSDVGTWGG